MCVTMFKDDKEFNRQASSSISKDFASFNTCQRHARFLVLLITTMVLRERFAAKRKHWDSALELMADSKDSRASL